MGPGGGGGGSWGSTSNDQNAIFYRERDAIFNALRNGENPYGSYENAVNSIYNTYGRDSGVSFQEVQGIIREAYDAANSGGSTRTGTSGGSTGPAMVRANLGDKIGALNQLYDLIYGDLNNLTQTRKSDLEKQYGEQRTGLQSQYEKNQAVMPNAFAAKGIRDSSYYERAATDAADTYNSNLNSIQQDQDAKTAQIGQQYQTALSGYQSARANLGGINPDFYGTQGDLDAVRGQLDQQANNLSAERSKLMTDSQYRSSLNSIAPTQNMGSSALQEQLAKITNSSIPGYAKDTIAKGLIKQSGEDPNFYTDYYEKLKGGLSTPLQ
jgi:hypothetical protein